MIAKLTGRVDSLEEGRCIIDVHGVGYQVHASTRTLAALPQPPEAAQLLIETHVREDAITLYGFAGRAERDWFRLLTAIQGVGAKVALGILSALSPNDLAAAIAAQDRTSLTRAPGVGTKLAGRLLSELRDKAGSIGAEPGFVPAPAFVSAPGIADDALFALIGLGYKRPEAQPVIARTMSRLGEAARLEEVIRDSLKELAQRGPA